MWLGVYLLYCVLQESSGCTVERGLAKPPIYGSVGDTVVLPCTCKGPGLVDPQAVQWGYKKHFIPGQYEADYSVVSLDGTQNQRYRDRVQRPTQNPSGEVSLIISPLTEEDEGTYLCGNHDYNRAVTLYVGGCTVLEEGRETITRSPGESVLLPCPCQDKKYIKPERVTWSYSTDQTVSNDAGSYRGRVRTFNQTGSRNLSLLISDLTEQDAGQYYCKSDQHKSNVGLQVKGCALVENKQTVKVNRSAGESVLLSCTCTDPQDSPVTVQWRGPNQEDLLQRSRVQTFTKTSPGDLSVLISDLTVEDGGTYSCWINQNQYRTFTLTVKDCTLSQTQENQIIRYPGQSVLLPCSCTDPYTKPLSVKWERVDPGGTEGSSKEVIFSDRVQMFNKSHPSNLSLLISNLTEQDQGTYRYSINNNQPISISLNITAATRTTTSTTNSSLPVQGENWVLIIIICAVLLILLLLGGGAACTYRKHVQGRKQRKDKDTGQRTNQADDDYENDPRNISMGPVYQSLDPKTNQSDSVYQSLNPKTNQSDSVYQSLDPKTNQSDSVYQSLDPRTN